MSERTWRRARGAGLPIALGSMVEVMVAVGGRGGTRPPPDHARFKWADYGAGSPDLGRRHEITNARAIAGVEVAWVHHGLWRLRSLPPQTNGAPHKQGPGMLRARRGSLGGPWAVAERARIRGSGLGPWPA